jgi:hypothetical protein
MIFNFYFFGLDINGTFNYAGIRRAIVAATQSLRICLFYLR